MTFDGDKPLVVITGSSGLIGTALVEALCGDFRVAGLDLNPPEASVPGFGWTECDMTDHASVERALGSVREQFGDRIASVFHLAAYYDFSGEPSPLYHELTVEGTRRLLRELQGFRVQQFAFSSTLLAMKPSEDDEPVDASSPLEAEWDYPRSKLDAEKVIEEERGNIHTVILRIAGVYDEGCHSLPVAQQISRIYQKQLESYLFPGDKTCGQSFIHLKDLTECVRQVLRRREALAPHEVFVIGEEDVMSYEELQEASGELLHGKEWPTIRIPKVAAKAGAWVKDKLAGDDGPFIKPWMIDLADQNYPVSIQHARERLRWMPVRSLRGTLPEMVRRLKADPRRWYEANGLPLPEELQKEAEATETSR